MRICLALVAVLMTIPAIAQEKFEDHLLKAGLEFGTRYSDGYGKVSFGSKIGDMAFTHTDNNEEADEARMLFRLWPQYPTGKELFAVGLNVRSYPEDMIAQDDELKGEAKLAFSLSYKVGKGSVYLDYPLAYVSDGVRWYPRIVVEDVGVRVWKNLHLTADATWDIDPRIGHRGSLNLLWQSNNLKVKVGTAGAAVAIGSGFNF